MDSAVFRTAVFGVDTWARAGQTRNRGAINGSGKIFVSSWDPTVWVQGTLSLLFKGYRGLFLQDQNSKGVTTQLHPVPRERMLSVLLPSNAKRENAFNFTSIQCQEKECCQFYFHPVPRVRMLTVLLPSSAKNAVSFTSIQCQESCQLYFHPVPRVRMLTVLLPSSSKNAVSFYFHPVPRVRMLTVLLPSSAKNAVSFTSIQCQE